MAEQTAADDTPAAGDERENSRGSSDAQAAYHKQLRFEDGAKDKVGAKVVEDTGKHDLLIDPGSGEICPNLEPKDPRVCDYYRCKPMPGRFNHPAWFKGYGGKREHLLYSTTNNEYGMRPPTVHTMPSSFFDRPQKFTNHLIKCGFWRNRSLNCTLDKSIAPQ